LNRRKLNESEFKLGVGYLVYFDEDTLLMFQDSKQKLHPINKISFLTDEWNTEDGNKNLPKPYIFDSDNNVTKYGDNLLYGYIDDAGDNIVVFGSLKSLALDQFDSSLNTDLTDLNDIAEKVRVRNNEQRYFSVSDDGLGEVDFYIEGKDGDTPGTGNLIVKVKGTKDNGIVKVEANGKIVINQTQTDDNGKETVIAQILFDNTKDSEKISIVDKNKNIITINADGVTVQSPKAINLTTDGDLNATVKGNLTVETDGNTTATVKGDLEVDVDGTATIKSPNAVITGGELKVNGTATPNGQGGFCGIPNCIFSGAPHVGSILEGT
jgi:hypothetical protein